MKLKILEYNILNGFHSEKEPHQYQPKRQKLVQKIVKKENPDIIAITEASFAHSSRHNILQDYAALFNYPHVFIGKHGEKSGTAILSRLPFTPRDYALKNFAFVRVQFEMGLLLDIVHPHPSVLGIEKAKFIRGVIRDMKAPYVLTGDFNALSPQDTYDKARLLKGFSRFEKERAQPVVEDFLKAEMVNEVIQAGLIDTLLEKKKDWSYTIPTDMLSKDKDSGIRIDFIFCSKDMKVIDAGIIKNKDTERASDHYPVYAILEF